MSSVKTRVALIFGGSSAEHDISIQSAHAIFTHLDTDRFDPRLIYISRTGKWREVDADAMESPSEAVLCRGTFHSILPWTKESCDTVAADIYFPVLHGPNGEDGKIPAMLELAGLPFVGADSLSSGLAMDKGVAKSLFMHAGLNTPPFMIFRKPDAQTIKKSLCAKLTYPLFVKPCSMGSSVGISKVSGPGDLEKAVQAAFEFDSRVIVEQGVAAREIEVAVMGNTELEISRPGELIPHNEFYDYEDKYLEKKTAFEIPAALDTATESRIMDMAARAYECLYLNGLSRIDFFVDKNTGEPMINEINTMPGFTEISMFPKLFALKGYSFKNLVTRLIEYGFDFHRQKNRRKNIR